MSNLTPPPHKHPEKQVFLKFYGSLSAAELTVELQIFRQGDRNQLVDSIVQTITANPLLAQQVQDHWQLEYRPLFPGRMIKPKRISLGKATVQSCQRSARSLMEAMNVWLSGIAFQPIREVLLRALDPQERIQILIQSCDRALQQLPWSQWQLLQAYPHAAVTLSTLDAQPLQPRPTRQRLRILGILGANENIATQSDKQLLEALPRDRVEVQILDQPNRADLTDQLWEQSWDMILFAGHGTTTEAGQGILYLNDAQETLSLNDIWYGLRKAVNAGLQLALFNSCAGLGLLARNLQDEIHIPQMIVMRDVVPDVVAQTFLRHLLNGFAAGAPLYQAAKTARERLQGLEGEFPCASWLPVIWQNPYATSLGLAPEPISERAPETPPQPEIKPAPRRRQRPVMIVGGLMLGAIALWGLRSPLAQWFNAQGNVAYDQQKFRVAEQHFQRAAFLDPNYPHPRYGLAWLYDEILGQPEQAQQWYQEAALLSFPEGIAEHVRLTLLQRDRADVDYSGLLRMSKTCVDTTSYPGTKASCLKNQGWIRFEQQNWSKAEIALRAAIASWEESPHAHCLLAQVLEAQGNEKAAQPYWRKTQKYSKEHIQEQDDCLQLAEQRLE